MFTLKKQTLIALFWMPSTYGFLGMLTTFILYALRIISWDVLNTFTASVIILTISSFLISSLFYLRYFRKLVDRRASISNEMMLPSVTLILVLYLIGLAGIIKYISDYAAAMGGISNFVSALVSQSYLIREQTRTTQSIGTQMSYFGWIAIVLTVLYFTLKSRKSLLLLVLLLLTFVGNLFWIDRTRPLTIVFMGIAVWLFANRGLRISGLLRTIAIIVVLGLGGFLLLGTWSGKVTATSNVYGETQISSSLLNIYVYLTSSYPYLNHVMEVEPVTWTIQRSIYPLAKIFSMIGLGPEPPLHVLGFYSVPYPTNVGTFLEMYYKETGIFGMVIGIFIYCFALNYMALIFLRTRRALAIIAWSMLCWISLFAFFTPKIASTETWLIVGLGLLSTLPWVITLKTIRLNPRIVLRNRGVH